MITPNETSQGSGTAALPGATQEHLKTLADEASATLADVKEQGAEQYEHYRDLAAEQLDSLMEGAQSAASALQGKDSLGLSQYLAQLATGLGSFADQVRDKSAEELLHKGAQLARDNPAVFLAGSVAIGFGLSRFLRASATHQAETATGQTGSPSAPPAYGALAPQQPAIAPQSSQQPALAQTSSPSPPGDADPLGDATPYPGGDDLQPGDNFKGGAI